MNAGDFIEIERVVRETYKCATRYLGSRQVTETLPGEPTWKGIVDIFALLGHPKAQRCYAWQWPEDGEITTIIVLEIPPMMSPQTAVQAAIASQARKKRNTKENVRVLTEDSSRRITEARDSVVRLRAARQRGEMEGTRKWKPIADVKSGQRLARSSLTKRVKPG
jgi:hypothetical protein